MKKQMHEELQSKLDKLTHIERFRYFLLGEYWDHKEQLTELHKSDKMKSNCKTCLMKLASEKFHIILMCTELVRLFLATLEDQSDYESQIDKLCTIDEWTKEEIADIKSLCKDDAEVRKNQGEEYEDIINTRMEPKSRHTRWEGFLKCKQEKNDEHIDA